MPNSLDVNKALRIEIQSKEGHKARKFYIFECANSTCTEEIRVRNDDLKRHSCFCRSHCQMKRPFESIYNGILQDIRWRPVPVELTYEEYLEFTKVPDCHYCSAKIDWQPYGTVDGEYISRAYYLDRKDNAIGYTRDNCVVCCTWCNIFRRNLLTYEEMKVAMEAIMKLRTKEVAVVPKLGSQ